MGFKSESQSSVWQSLQERQKIQSSWVGFWRLPDSERDYMILPLHIHERNLVLRANALRFSRPSHTMVVHTVGYLRFSFWEGKTYCAFDCGT